MKRAIAGMVASGAALAALSSGAAAITGPPRTIPAPTPPAATLSGTITSATGLYAGDHGRVVIRASDIAAHRPGRLVISGSACRGARRCLSLAGRPSGTMTIKGRPIPDAGYTFSVHAAGRVAPLGHVTVTGQLEVPGFVFCGHETITLTLTAARGAVTLSAQTHPRCRAPQPVAPG